MAIAIENPSTTAAVVVENTGLAVESVIATITARDIEKANSDDPRQYDADWHKDLLAQIDNHELE